MSSSKTSNYNLNQWVKSDRVLMSEFNSDNAKIDAGIKAVDQRVDSLSTTVAGKASASALSALQSTVNSHTAALTKAGNCQLYVTSYVGNGGFGENSKNSLTFPHKPFVVFLEAGTSVFSLLRGTGTFHGLGSSYLNLTWSGNSLSWYSSSAANQLNEKNLTYHVFALLEL